MSPKSLVFIKKFSTEVKTVNLFTTPIYYVNASPHIGHLYSSVIADAAQRWQKLFKKGCNVKFSTGTDEHGSKIQQAAIKHKVDVRNYCDNISDQFKKLNDEFSIQYTEFIRTSQDHHKKTVEKLWTTLFSNNHIYSSTYQGWYCVQEETFLMETQLKEIPLPNGQISKVSLESGHPVEWTQEQNYMFKLSNFRKDIEHWINSHDSVIRPTKFKKILLDILDFEEDLSVSRPSSRVHWGIQVPNDSTQTIYVWLDALANYLTVARYCDSNEIFKTCWPPDIQVIGKDILKFHGLYWPAFLIAAGLDPPKSIFCHSHWTVNGEKMSKSKGNVVCPFDRAKTYTTDGLRYFLLREGVAHSDGNYSDMKVNRILNSELADTLGNLLSRCTGQALNPLQKFPKIETICFELIASKDVTKQLLEKVSTLPDICQSHYGDLNFYKVADSVISTLHAANLFFETMKPWELKKQAEFQGQLNVVLHLTLETLRVCSILLQPLIPNLSTTLLDKINVDKENRYFSDLKSFSWMDSSFQEKDLSPSKVVLFRRILAEGVEKTRKKI